MIVGRVLVRWGGEKAPLLKIDRMEHVFDVHNRIHILIYGYFEEKRNKLSNLFQQFPKPRFIDHGDV